ncbi:RNase adapter RapZ [Polycyclovorans algicola]|uniref:RNase adapter RapZ n=1 Tax=Polycyclovorans algicola TaxID=616992 RepID=UPI0004A6AA7A|nr:RNase adapter RapZ [Polycyclovorans algicola]
MKLVIVSGLSGAGKTVALKQYEDLGYTCIDNLPLNLLESLVIDALARPSPRYEELALGIDARESPELIAAFSHYLEQIQARGVTTRVVFLTANEDTLLSRYSETRRRHPLSDHQRPLIEAIRLEQQLLAPIANAADTVLDTSPLNLHELRERIHGEIPGGGRDTLALTLMSFGFKHGAPNNADFVFDVRCLPNPHWNRSLRSQTGRDATVRNWLEEQPAVLEMRSDLLTLLERWLPAFRAQDRAYLTVAIGCTGGQHRSVYLVESLADALRPMFDKLVVRHRELRGSA